MTRYMSSIGGVSGLSSGVNWREVIDSLLAMERKPANLLKQRQQRVGAQISALAEISARLLELKSRAFTLGLSGTLAARKVEVSGGAITATATPEAAPGTYRVTVLSLATPTVAAAPAPLGRAVDATLPLSQALPTAPKAGYLTVNGTKVHIDDATTLGSGENSLFHKVNSSGAGVRALLVPDGAGRPNTLALYTLQESLTLGSASDTSDLLSLVGLAGSPVRPAWVSGVMEGGEEGKVAADLSGDVTLTFAYGGNTYTTSAGDLGAVQAGVTTLSDLAARLEAAMNRALGGAGRVTVAVDDPDGSGNGRLVVMDRSGGGGISVVSLDGAETGALQPLLPSGGAQAGRAAVGQVPLGRLSTARFLHQAGFAAPLKDGWLSGFLAAQGEKAGFDLEGSETVTFTYRGNTYQTAPLEAVRSGVTDLAAVASDLEAKINAALGEAGAVRVSLLRDEAGRVRLAFTDLSDQPYDSRALEFTASPDPLRLLAPQGGRAGGAVVVNGKVIYYDKYSDTLSGVLSRMSNAGAGVRASYDPLADRVTLTATVTGPVALDLWDGAGNLLEALGISDPSAQILGSPASIKVEGFNQDLPFYSASNTISGLIPGITLHLREVSGRNAAGELVPITLTVQPDVSGAVKAVKDFVESFNATVSKISEYLRYDAEKKQAGLLAGFPHARDVLNRLRSFPSWLPEGIEGGLRTLMDIGISLGRVGGTAEAAKGGQLVLDEDRLAAALRENPDRVYRVLSAYTGQVRLEPGGTGSVSTAVGRPERESRAGRYRIVSDGEGNLTVYFRPAGGDEELVGSGTIGAYGTNDTLIPGVTLRAGALKAGEDFLVKEASSTGVLKRLEEYLGQVTSKGGLLAGLTTALEKTNRDLAAQLERMDERLKAQEARLVAQFSTLEKLLARMQTQSQWLTNQIRSINRNWRGSE